MFACEHWGVDGDILCLAKGLANGLPLGAIVARRSVMDWPSGSHASTFGGNPVACAAALATLRLVQKRYQTNAVERGEQLREGLEQLASRHATIREVRGLGLMIGAEIQGADGHPSPRLRNQVIQEAFHQGLLLLPCGPSTLRFCPPLCLSQQQVEVGLEILENAFEAVQLARPGLEDARGKASKGEQASGHSTSGISTFHADGPA
jgi:4-aminobutyrate aminotransferase